MELYVTIRMASQSRVHGKSAIREEGLDWQSVLSRTMKVHILPEGRPYTADGIKGALLAYGLDVDDIELVGPLAQHKTWQVVFATKVGHDAVLAKSPFLDILTLNGRFHCPLSNFFDEVRTMRVHWLPAFIPTSVLRNTLEDFGSVHAVIEEAGGESFTTRLGTQLVTMTVDGHVDDFPDTIQIYFEGQSYTIMLTVLGERVRCHRCHQRGHVRSKCRATCTTCGSEDHITLHHGRVALTAAASVPGTTQLHKPGTATLIDSIMPNYLKSKSGAPSQSAPEVSQEASRADCEGDDSGGDPDDNPWRDPDRDLTQGQRSPVVGDRDTKIEDNIEVPGSWEEIDSNMDPKQDNAGEPLKPKSRRERSRGRARVRRDGAGSSGEQSPSGGSRDPSRSRSPRCKKQRDDPDCSPSKEREGVSGQSVSSS